MEDMMVQALMQQGGKKKEQEIDPSGDIIAQIMQQELDKIIKKEQDRSKVELL